MEKITKTNEILNIIKDNEKITLKELYIKLPTFQKSSIRAVVNLNVKKGIIKRIEKSTYCIQK